MKNDKPLMTVRQVAERLSVSMATICRMEKTSVLPSVRFGSTVRFDRAAVEQFIERCKQ